MCAISIRASTAGYIGARDGKIEIGSLLAWLDG
jgi:hypothetical protein